MAPQKLVCCAASFDDELHTAVFSANDLFAVTEWVGSIIDEISDTVGSPDQDELAGMIKISAGYLEGPHSWQIADLPFITKVVLDEDVFRIP